MAHRGLRPYLQHRGHCHTYARREIQVGNAEDENRGVSRFANFTFVQINSDFVKNHIEMTALKGFLTEEAGTSGKGSGWVVSSLV